MDLVKPAGIGNTLVTLFKILSPIAKAVVSVIFIGSILTMISSPVMIIILMPVLAYLLSYLVKNAHKQLPSLVESEVKTRLNPLLLPPIVK